jgi:hypothetical protein
MIIQNPAYVWQAGDGDSAGDLPNLNGTESSEGYGVMSQSDTSSVATEAVSEVPGQINGTTGNDRMTFEEFQSNVSGEEEALVRAKDHVPVGERPRVLQRASWESTHPGLECVGATFEQDDQIFDYSDLADEDM